MLSRNSTCFSLGLALFAVFLAQPAVSEGSLIHRYSFNENGGAVLTDSVGGADGTLLGAGGALAGGQMSLPGGSSGSAAYGDLPNGLISGLTDVTIEGWYTPTGVQNWMRVFDFGSTDVGGGTGGELGGPGGGGNGLDYLFYSSVRGTDPTLKRVEIRNEDAVGGGPSGISTFDATTLDGTGAEHHFAVVFDADGGGPGVASVALYRDGVLLTSGNTSIQLSNLNDVNNWLGRSNWTADGNFEGSYNEFRIYDMPLSEAEVLASRAAGPDANLGPIPEPSVATLSLLAALGVGCASRRRRGQV